MHSITYTWSRQASTDRRDEPAWTTHARRILPGQQIRINRDDDAEEGDLGIRRFPTESVTGEKLPAGEGSSGESGTGSGSSRREEIEMQERASVEEHEQEAEYTTPVREDRGRTDSEEGRRTPPLAEYREGHHLVIERRRGSGDEVEVEVIRNAFDDEPAESSTFTHPHRLKSKELDKIKAHLPVSVEHAVSQVENHGKDAVDALGLGLMTSRPRTPSPDRTSDRDGRSRSPSPSPSPERASRPPVIKLPGAKPFKGLRNLFRRDSSPSPGVIEEGRAAPDPSLLLPPSSGRPRPVVAEPEPMSSNDRSLQLSRTLSVPRNTSIRFAAETSESSDTAPSVGNYGNTAPGFKRNPGLAMYRTSSVQSTGSAKGESGPSVSFREPELRR